MKYYLKNNPKDLIDLKESMIIGEAGNDGEVYKYENQAIKLFHISKLHPAMNLKKARLFKEKLDLKSYIKIEDLLYDENGKYSGYSMIYEEEDYNKTLKMLKIDFLDNIKDLIYDINQFSKINCNIIDLAQLGYQINCICNTRIRPIDMDNYEIDKTMTYNELYSSNIGAIRNLLFQIFLILYEKKILSMDDGSIHISKEIIDLVYSELETKLYDENILEYFEKELKNYDTLDQYFEDKIKYVKKYIYNNRIK